ncbi:sulfatase [Seonamhaeicola sp. MEBiC1930]|uniref:sulfatase family protein n=1 Tax=Seonamhaeicola sp. MEBiC01930 TaxID=2976768 RepID=UPI0032508FD1
MINYPNGFQWTALFCFLFHFLSYTQEQKPNFLIVLGDDISASNIGCYGSLNLNTTPNIDKLAKEGIRFTNMYVTEAMCAPTRAELFTGLMPYKNGCTVNHGATKKDVLSVVQHLENLGYRVGLTGKRHFKPSSVYPFEFVDGFTKNCVLNGKVAEEWSGVEEFIARDPNQPFCLFICSVNAHSPWDAGDTSSWDIDDVVLPKNLVDTKETRHYFREYLAEIRLFDEQVGNARNLLKKKNLENNTVFIVLDENGAGMPFGKWSTYDFGVRSACVMKWPEPNNHKLVTPAISKYCDILPTLIDAAGGKVPTNLDGKSLMPIITKKNSKHRNHAFFLYNSNGHEGTKYHTRAVTDGKYKLIWTLTPENIYGVRTINGFDYGHVDKIEDRHVRKMYLSWVAKAGYDKEASGFVKRFKYRSEFQLFDLDEDPAELYNLAAEPRFEQKVLELKSAIENWMKQQGDSGVKK